MGCLTKQATIGTLLNNVEGTLLNNVEAEIFLQVITLEESCHDCVSC